jgi:hypothetical protein
MGSESTRRLLNQLIASEKTAFGRFFLYLESKGQRAEKGQRTKDKERTESRAHPTRHPALGQLSWPKSQDPETAYALRVQRTESGERAENKGQREDREQRKTA